MGRILPCLPAAALAMALAGCDFDDWGSSQRFTEDFHHTYPLEPGGRLTLENLNGPVEIYGWNKNEVEIHGTKYAARREWLDAMRIDIAPSSDRIEVRTIRPSGERRGNMGARYRIHVPERTRLDRITTSNGGIRVESVNGDARLRTSNGGVRLAEFSGMVEAETSNGPIDLNGFDGGAVLRTSNGAIKASGVRGTFEATTSNGPIEASVEDIESSRPLRAKTSNGPVRLKIARLKNNDVIAQTSNGPITLTLPPGTSARLKAGTSNSSVDCDFDLTNTVTRSKTRIDGTIGSGGPLLDLSTSNGPIRVLR
jgi:DUF4097 and DUF4098 domain-containing protein YvlB